MRLSPKLSANRSDALDHSIGCIDRSGRVCFDARDWNVLRRSKRWNMPAVSQRFGISICSICIGWFVLVAHRIWNRYGRVDRFKLCGCFELPSNRAGGLPFDDR